MPGRTRDVVIWVTLLVGAVVGALLEPPVSDGLLALVVLTALGLTISSARSLRASRGWRMLTVASVCLGTAPALTEIHRMVEPDIGPMTAGDAVLALGYLLFIAGMRQVLDARTMAVQLRSVLDASLITLWIGFAALAWAGPELRSLLSGYPLAAALFYLPFSLAVVQLLLHLILGSESKSRSIWLLAATAGLTVGSELSFLALAAGHDNARQLGVALATLALVALSGAIRHPSAAELEAPSANEQDRYTAGHTPGLLGSIVVVIFILAISGSLPAYLLIMLSAIVAVSAANLFLTVRRRDRAIELERQLRHSVAEIMRAESTDDVFHLGEHAVDRLLEDKSAVEIDFLRHDGTCWVNTLDGRPTELDAEEREHVDQSATSGLVHRSEARCSIPGTRYRTRLIIPLTNVADHDQVLMVDAAPVLTTSQIEQLEQVASTVERALEALGLQEERHQRRADRRFRALVQDSGDVVALIDPEELLVTMVSPSMQRILGYPETDFLGHAAARHLHPDDRAPLADLVNNAVVRPQSSALDVRIRHLDGHYHWFSATVRDLIADDDVGGLVMNLTDIHDRKMAELTIGFSEQRYRAMVMNSMDVFAVLEPDLTISYISPNVEQSLGFSAQDLVASKISSLLTEESAEKLMQFMADARGALRNDVVELELRTLGRKNRIGEVTLSERADGVEGGFLLSVRDVTEQRRLERSLRNQALYDSLTGLANRTTLHFELQQRLQRLRATEYLGLIHLDINDFKSVNESVGYEAGDELLVAVATRLRSSLRDSDTLARLGGNEFVVATVTESESEIMRFAERVKTLFAEPFEIAGRHQRLAVSVGLDLTHDRRTVARSLIEGASLALGAARKSTQDHVHRFEPGLRASATERFELGADLGGAIARDELSVVYQPIVEIDSRKVRGVEALLRWTHPQRGPVSPGVFIPLAEKSGLVIELGRWVMGQACRQLLTWHETVPGAERLSMSVNVSALQLERPGEAAVLAQIVVESGVEPHRVTVELTESTLIEDAEWIRSQLEILQDLGMRVAVDDFGTGAAGLSHLRDVPFNVVKIDKSYVDALSQSQEAKTLVQGVIDLAHTLGAETVAEGIEQPTEFDLLQSLGCELGQGFFLARPMDPIQLEEWFALGRTGSVPALIAKPPTVD